MSTQSDATQLLPRIVEDDPRVHLLDDLWLLTVFVLLLAVGLPWLMGGVDYEIGAAMLCLLALGSVHLILASVAEGAGALDRHSRRLLTALHLGGVVLIGVIWQYAGALQNPALLAVFALPVMGAIFLSRWHSYLTALVALGVVGAVALIQVPELRWYAGGLRGVGAWLAHLFATEGGGAPPSFSSFYAPARYYLTLLEVFGVLLLSIAAAAEYLGILFERLYGGVRAAAAEAQRGQELWASLIDQLPLLAVLVDADSSTVIGTSQQGAARFGAIEGRRLLDAIRMVNPEALQELIHGEDGKLGNCILHLGDEVMVASASVRHLAQRGRRFALLVFTDETEFFSIKAALDRADHAALVIDSRGRVLAFNKPASGLFSGLAAGDAAADLPGTGSDPGWWEPGAGGRRKTHLTLPPRIYQVTCSAVLLPGTNERLVVAALLPVAKADAEHQQRLETTLVMPNLARNR